MSTLMMQTLTEQQLAAKEVAASLARKYAPHALEWDRGRVFFPEQERRRLGDLGFLGICQPVEYGGAGADILDALVVIEELAKECRPAAFQVFEANTGPARALALLGTERQKRRILPAVIRGESTVALGISEPDAGSAATDMSTRCKQVGDELVISGNKRWISGGGHANHYLVYCRFGDIPGARGIGAVIVDADAPGVSFGKQEQMMGFRGIPSADIYFDDVRVPAENLIRGPGHFRELFTSFSIERLGNATMSLAIGQKALDATLAYTQERMQFGKPLISFQSVQIAIADMALQVEAARSLIYNAAQAAGAGLPDPLAVSLAKCASNEMAKRVSDVALQLHGGNGYTEEYGIERLHRDAHGWALAGGTPTMQRIRILSEMLGRNFDQRS